MEFIFLPAMNMKIMVFLDMVYFGWWASAGFCKVLLPVYSTTYHISGDCSLNIGIGVTLIYVLTVKFLSSP